MAAPTPPSGVTQAELDALFAQIKIDGEAKKQNWMKAKVPSDLQPHWQYALENSLNTATVVTAVGTPVTGKGLLSAIIVNTLGATDDLKIHDAPNTGAANGENLVFQRAVADMTAGKVIMIGIPFNVALTVSSFPTGGNYTLVWAAMPPS